MSAPESDPGALLDDGAELVCRALADSCAVGVLFDGGRRIHPLGFFHHDPERREEIAALSDLAWTAADGGVGRILATGTPLFFGPDEIGAASQSSPWASAFAGGGADRCGLAVAMRALGTHVGVMALLRSADQGPFTSDDVQAAQLAGDHLGLAVHALQLGDELAGRTAGADAGDGRLATLSARERAIFRSIADGLTSREIANGLVLSVRTVEWHRARLMAKLETTSRSELIALGRTLRP